MIKTVKEFNDNVNNTVFVISIQLLEDTIYDIISGDSQEPNNIQNIKDTVVNIIRKGILKKYTGIDANENIAITSYTVESEDTIVNDITYQYNVITHADVSSGEIISENINEDTFVFLTYDSAVNMLKEFTDDIMEKILNRLKEELTLLNNYISNIEDNYFLINK